MGSEVETWLTLKYGDVDKMRKIYESAMERSLMVSPGPVYYYGEKISESDFQLMVRYFHEQE